MIENSASGYALDNSDEGSNAGVVKSNHDEAISDLQP
jgi:hypothetical protein